MPIYKINADIVIEKNVDADDPDDALSKFFDLLDDTDLQYEVNKYLVIGYE